MTENNQSISPNSVGVHQVPASQVIGEPGHEGEFIQMYSYAKKTEVQSLKEDIQNDIQISKDRMLVLETTIKNLKFLITVLSIIFTIIALFAKIFQ